MRSKRFFSLILFSTVVGCSVLFSTNVFAADAAVLKSKAVLEGAYRCLLGGAYSKRFKAGAQIGSGDNAFIASSEIEDDKKPVKLPYGLTSVEDNDLDCKEVMIGENGMLSKAFRRESNALERAKFFAGDNLDGEGGIGYKAKGDEGEEIDGELKQVKIRISIDPLCDDARMKMTKTDSVTLDPLEDGRKKITWEYVDNNTLVFPSSGKVDGKYKFVGQETDGINVPGLGAKTNPQFVYKICDSRFYVQWDEIAYYISTGGTNPAVTIEANNDVTGPDDNKFGPEKQFKLDEISVVDSSQKSEDKTYADYDIEWLGDSEGGKKFLSGLNKKNGMNYSVPGLEDYSGLQFTPQEIFDLYTYYIKNVYNVPVVCDGDANWDSASGNSDYESINWSNSKECKANKNSSNVVEKPKKKVYGVFGVKKEEDRHFGMEVDLDKILEQLALLDISDLDTSGAGTLTDSTPQPDDPYSPNVNNESTCQNSGAAKSLGWILCSALELMSDASESIYNNYVSPALQIDPKLFAPENNEDSTRIAWETFRNFANVFFIILLLFVIFSQLTGVGIDNYGIKKILPNLILVAVLINLSYLICVLCVDLSNILGKGLEAIFDALPPTTVSGKIEGLAEQSFSGGMVSVALIGIVGLAGFWGLSVVMGNPAVLLSLLVSALGIIISIFFLFILLAGREAAIVVLTVLSPLAFACYALPNTKVIFNKWMKFGQALLLLYPTCGLLVGGGGYVSRLILAAQAPNISFVDALTAMLVGIVPIFFIPMLLRGSFAMLGKIGGMITGFGTLASRRATGAVRGSAAYKGAQERGTEFGTGLRARMSNSRLGVVFAGGRRGVARARSQDLANRERRRRENYLMNGGYDTALAGIESKADEQEVADSQAMLTYGRAKNKDGSIVNTNSADSLGTYHREALERYRNASTEQERNKAMADVRAAQNLLSKTDSGRSQVQNNLEQAVANGNTAGLALASSHLLSNFGDTYKSKNRGAHALINELATASRDDKGEVSAAAISGMQNKMRSGGYDTAGTNKYTQESLAGADIQALKRMANGVEGGMISGEQLNNIRDTARKTISMYESGKLSAQPEALDYIRRIAGTGAGGSVGGGATVSAGGAAAGGAGAGGAAGGGVVSNSQVFDGDLDDNYDISNRPEPRLNNAGVTGGNGGATGEGFDDGEIGLVNGEPTFGIVDEDGNFISGSDLRRTSNQGNGGGTEISISHSPRQNNNTPDVADWRNSADFQAFLQARANYENWRKANPNASFDEVNRNHKLVEDARAMVPLQMYKNYLRDTSTTNNSGGNNK